MRRGFTMIELVFVIVILGILASIAIPRLAASRDDARAVSLKSDIGTISQAVPAWYQGQGGEITITGAASIDTTIWVKTPNSMEYTYDDGRDGNIVVRVVEVNATWTQEEYDDDPVVTPLADAGDDGVITQDEDVVTAGFEPWLTVNLNPAEDGIVETLVTDMQVANGTFPMAGRRVVWN